jgi:hypothetical protein
VDLVRGLGHGALHHLLVLVRKNRRHCGELGGIGLVMVMVKACLYACACACECAAGLWRVPYGGACSSREGWAAHEKESQSRLSMDKRLLHAQWVITSGSSGDGHGIKEYWRCLVLL